MKKTILTLLAAVVCSLASGQTKSVSILGDSYSTYEDFVTPSTNELWYYAKSKPERTDVKDVRQTWWHQVIKENGWRLCVNNSYSGATISYTGYDGNDYRDRSFNTRMTDLGNPDIIFIFGATNDSWAGTPIGEYKYEGITYGDLYQFRPALARMLDWMTARYVNTEIYFILNNDEEIVRIGSGCSDGHAVAGSGVDKFDGVVGLCNRRLCQVRRLRDAARLDADQRQRKSCDDKYSVDGFPL